MFFNLNVLAASNLELTSVRVAEDTVSQGQSGRTIYVRVANSGGTAIEVNTLRLTAGKSGLFATGFEKTGLNDTLLAGSDSLYTFSVDIAALAPAGIVTLSASIAAVDLQNDAAIVISAADTSASWQVQTPAAIEILSFAPVQVSTGMDTLWQVDIRNNGQADLRVEQRSKWRLSAANDSIALASDAVLFGGQNATLLTESATIITSAGSYPPELTLYGQENGSPVEISASAALQTLLVQDPALLLFNTLSLTSDTVTVNDADTLLINVSNGGGGADLRLDSLKVVGNKVGRLQVLNFVPRILTAGFATDLEVAFAIPSVIPVDEDELRITIYGRDVNDHVVLSAFDVDSLFFLGAADLQIADFSLPEEGVFIGPQYDISWTFINAGGTPVVLDSVLVLAQNGSYDGRNPVPVRRTLGQGVSHTGQTTLSVNINSATGRDSLWLAAYVTNTRTSIQDLIVFAGQKESWVIEGNGEVRIDFVSVPQRLVSRGQTDFPVRVSLTNTGKYSRPCR
jgi:hypothetical protein